MALRKEGKWVNVENPTICGEQIPPYGPLVMDGCSTLFRDEYTPPSLTHL